MSTIWDKITFSYYQRPTYTNYELGSMVREKRLTMGLPIVQFVKLYNIDNNILMTIEMCTRSFNHSLYKICSDILEIPLEEIVKYDVDTKPNMDNISKEAKQAIEIANELFHEMVMMHKIHAQ